MSKNLKILIIVLVVITAIFIVTDFALAVDVWGNQQTEINAQLQLGAEDPRVIVANVIRITLGFLGIIAVILVMYAGFLWMTAGGEASKIDRAKKVLIGALIGVVIIISAFAIVTFVLGKLLVSTGPGCTDGDTRSCGCGGMGTQTCSGGVWGSCAGDCAQCCCNEVCQSCPCGSGPPPPVSCDANPLTPACEPDNTICSLDEYCATSTCTCVLAGEFGDPCDSNTATPSCDPDDNMCAAYLQCDVTDCICIGAPVIEWISPVDGSNTPNGAPGNFITIGGRYFGTTTGEVYFWDGSDFTILASFPNSVNPNCTNNWQDNQIIVIVPSGAIDGPIKVVRVDSQEDTTDNARGPSINDFDINSIVRPGLCLVNPDNGYFEDAFNLQGISFNGTMRTVKFGNEVSSSTANNISGWTNTSVDAEVPNITGGRTTVFIEVDNEISNFLRFTVFYDYANNPVIDYIDPSQGPRGQYITIYGSNFKSYRAGFSVVQFYLPADPDNLIYADIDFPEECQDNWWHDSYIIVKVPDIGVGGYRVIVTNRDNNVSTPADFTVTIGSPNPGLCLLDPHNGLVGQSVTAIGDNFKASQGSGRTIFYNNQSGVIDNWSNQRINNRVPSGAQTGPFKVVDSDSNVSNSLPFTVGVCSSDAECQTGEECCGPETYWSGICRATGTCGEGGFATCAFGWTFSTRPAAPGTCRGYSTAEACVSVDMCPNSPGQCQTRGSVKVGECGDDYCNNTYSVCLNNCLYDSSLNKCKSGGVSCDETNDTLITGYTAECHEVNSQGVWQIDPGGASCPLGTFMDTNGWCTVGTIDSPVLCSICSTGFSCQTGICVIGSTVCPSNSTCLGNECILDNPICECCCRVGYDAQDCCLGLTCEPGHCGPGAPNWGVCTGCRVELDGNRNTVTTEEQIASDEACNCYNMGNRYCHIIIGDPLYDNGVCEDTGEGDPCDSDLVSPGCQADNSLCAPSLYCELTSCTCQSGGPGDPCDSDTASPGCQADDTMCSPGQYCEVSSCTCQIGIPCDSDTASPGCQADDTMCPVDQYCNPSTCLCHLAGPGEECLLGSVPACINNIYACFFPYQCLANTIPDDCRCCCDTSAAVDPCLDIGSGNLNCMEADPCVDDSRGLCCGCEQDSDCGDPNNIGCGIDTCCRGRPNVVTIDPWDETNNICRNALISATFDKKMNISSFIGNVIVVGEYSGQCPDGTQYLTLNNKVPQKRNIFVQAYKKVLKAFERLLEPILGPILVDKALADTPNPSMNYCAITGSVSGYHSPSGDSTILTFSPLALMDALTKYFVIIKGDTNLDSSKGVLSYWGIGINGPNKETFNSIEFNNAKIWSFTTLSEAIDEGICQIDYVDIYPGSYLFQTIENNLNDENDNDPNDVTFDTVRDSDKVFVAKAMSADGQALVSVTGFEWTWSWTIDNPSVANIISVSGLDDNKRLIRTGTGVTDSKTYINATANVLGGFAKTGKADVWVFLCENPWPTIDSAGLWSPWRDTSSNCNVAGPGTCYNTNYEIYYCRDSGNIGTVDDLPAVLSDNAIIRGETSDILKEAYFFREEAPTGSTALSINIDPTGGSVTASWGTVPGAAGYKLYWGTSSNNYSDYQDVGSVTNYFITGLTNNIIYYFNLTSYSSGGAESDFYGEVSAIPQDLIGPSAPTIDSITPDDKEVTIEWSDTSGGDAVSFRIWYRAESVCNSSVNFADSIAASISPTSVTNLSNGIDYCFGLLAYDQYANASGTTTGAAIPLAAVTGLAVTAVGDSSVSLSWNSTEGADDYNIYYGIDSGDYGSPMAVGGGTTYIVSGLINDIPYYFAVKSVNADGVENVNYSNEVSGTPVAP